MPFWSVEQCEDFVRAHTSGAERVELLHPARQLFDERHPNVFVGYDSLARWIHWQNIITLDEAGAANAKRNADHFKRLLVPYRADKADYQSKVKSRLRQIKMRRSGVALFEEFNRLDNKGQWVTIVPYHHSGTNAYTETGIIGSIHGTAKGVPVNYSNKNSPKGDGEGASPDISFSPDMWTGSAMAGPGNAPDEVLYHELVHATRLMNGLLDTKPMNGQYDNQEELLAVMLTNIYQSEKGQTVFRGNHSNGTMQGIPANSFLQNGAHLDIAPVTIIEMFRKGQQGFYSDLAKLPAPPNHNWIRQFDMRQDYYRQRTKSDFRM